MRDISETKTAICPLWSGQALLVRFPVKEERGAEAARRHSRRNATEKHDDSEKKVTFSSWLQT